MTEQVEALMQKCLWDEASAEANRLCVQHPTNARIHGYVGLCYYRLGKFEDAVAPLKQAVILDEFFIDAGVKLVQSLDRLQRYEEALEFAEEFAKRDPNEQTLKRLINGLRRQVPDKITDNWQLSVHLDRYEVRLASEAD